jgi:hypothetical protein
MMVLGSSSVFILEYPDNPVTKALEGLAKRVME